MMESEIIITALSELKPYIDQMDDKTMLIIDVDESETEYEPEGYEVL